MYGGDDSPSEEAEYYTTSSVCLTSNSNFTVIRVLLVEYLTRNTYVQTRKNKHSIERESK